MCIRDSSIFGFGTDLSPSLLGVGYIVGPLVGCLVLAGGLISWMLGIPIYLATADPEVVATIVGDATGYSAAQSVWSAQIRYMGVGAMVVGGVWALVSLLGAVREGVRSSLEAVRVARTHGGDQVPRTERDTPITIVGVGTIALALSLIHI